MRALPMYRKGMNFEKEYNSVATVIRIGIKWRPPNLSAGVQICHIIEGDFFL